MVSSSPRRWGREDNLRRRSGTHSLGVNGRVEICRDAIYWIIGEYRTYKGWSGPNRSPGKRSSLLLIIRGPSGGLRCGLGPNRMV